MTPETDRNFRREVSDRIVERILNTALKVLLCLLIGLVAVQIGLLFWVSNQCATVYGLSVEGRIFETYSFTCPSETGVEPLFRGRPRS